MIGGHRSLHPIVLQSVKLVTTTAQDTSEATLASNVSYHSILAPSIHGQTHPLGPMHACLNMDEIVRLIALELVTSRGEATAVSLACCCKDFEDPALDALWMTQDSLFTLLKSFPGDVWNKKDCTVSAPTICVILPSR